MANVLTWFTTVFVFMIVSSEDSPSLVIVEKGQQTSLQCTFPNNITSVTWQLLNGSAIVAVSNCSNATNTCDDKMKPLYLGQISNSGSDKVVSLNVTSARKNETRFSCLADNGLKSNEIVLVVYAWPTIPSCSQNLTKNYMEYICTTGNVYPNVTAELHRRGESFSTGDFNYKNCSLGLDGNGTGGDFSATCTWRFPWENMIHNTTVYVEMFASRSDGIMINKSAAVSIDKQTTFPVPGVIRDPGNCPVGPGVRGESIKIGTTATCKCVIDSSSINQAVEVNNFSPFARWFAKDNTVVGVENMGDGSSTLTLSYSSSDPNPVYECRPMPQLKTDVAAISYTPKFTSSAPPSITIGLQPFVIILGAFSYGIVSRFT